MDTAIKHGIFNKMIADLNTANDNIEASAVISCTGLPVCSSLNKTIDEDRVSAVTAAALAMGENTAKEMHYNLINHILIKTTDSYVLIQRASPDELVAVVTPLNAPIDDVSLSLERLFTPPEDIIQH